MAMVSRNDESAESESYDTSQVIGGGEGLHAFIGQDLDRIC